MDKSLKEVLDGWYERVTNAQNAHYMSAAHFGRCRNVVNALLDCTLESGTSLGTGVIRQIASLCPNVAITSFAT